jgi:hypothetical protein
MAEKVRQLDPSTTDEDSNKKVLDTVSIILILKKVADKTLVSVVLQYVGREGLRRKLIESVREAKLVLNY